MRLFIQILFICTGIQLQAQKFFFKQYSIEEGLPQSTVFAIEQDKLGYLWIGTEGRGICRFDGKNFENFTKTDGLAGNVVRAILSDKNGNLWIGTEQGISLFNGLEFKNITTNDRLNGTVILNLFESKNNSIWALTNDGGINIIEHTEDSTFLIQHFSTNDGLTSNFVTDVVEHNGYYWVSAMGGINVLSHKNKRPKLEKKIQVNSPFEIVWDLEKSGEDTIWLSTYNSGTYFLTHVNDVNQARLQRAQFLDKKNITRVWNIFQDSKKNIWFASDQRGLLKYRNGQIVAYSSENGFTNNQILTVFEDHEKNIWAGTMGYGLLRFTGETFVEYKKDYGLDVNHISCIELINNNNLLVGSDNGIFLCEYFKNSDLSVYEFLPGKFNNIQVRDILVEQKNKIWIGTYDQGILLYENNKLYRFGVENGLADNKISCLHLDARQRLWIGTSNGYSLFDGHGFINFNENNGLINNEIQTIKEDNKGRIWIGTLGGLVKIEGNQYQDFNEEEGLLELRILTLAPSYDGNIWIGTFGDGIYKFNINSNASQPIEKVIDEEILLSGNIYSLMWNDKHHLIVGTDNGFNEITFDGEKNLESIVSYNKSDGFSGVEINQNAIVKDKASIWFGTIDGLIKYTPNQKPTNYKPKIYLTELRLFNQEINSNDLDQDETTRFNIPVRPVFNYKENHLTFVFSCISYTNPERINFQYKIPALNDEWSGPQKDFTVVLTDLNPSKYSIQTRVLINNRIFNSDQTYEFIIRPPFFKTWWFIGLMVLLFIIVLIIYIQFREKKLKQDKRKLEKAVDERTQEIQKQKSIVENQKQQITDSILYAKKIQEAALPDMQSFNSVFPDNFILFKPRDHVSGDFYWSGKVLDHIIIAAADCTGHGVPGAFMSMLGISFLNDVVNEKKSVFPNEILDYVRENNIKALKQKNNISETKDGMDIALCSINRNKNKLYFSGANNPLFQIRQGKLMEYKGDKMPVAIHWEMKPFTCTEINIQKDDCIYLFSDGYRDQFGGPKKKKYMLKKFKNLLIEISGLEMNEQLSFLNSTFEEWKGDLEQVDDVLVIGIRI